MKIKLSGKCGKGKFALIDEDNLVKILSYKWYVDSKGYVYREKCKVKRIFLHQVIMGDYPKDKKQIDHINRNKRDNRKINLRFCTNSENHQNKGKYKSNTSGYVGVFWHPKPKKWMARLYIYGKSVYLGLFTDKQGAINAIKKAKNR